MLPGIHAADEEPALVLYTVMAYVSWDLLIKNSKASLCVYFSVTALAFDVSFMVSAFMT